MSDLLVYDRAPASFAAGLAQRGHHIVYRANELNRCPGCGRSQWYVGRVSAECGFCGAAVPLADAHRGEAGSVVRRKLPRDQRQHERTAVAGRELQLLIDGSPRRFALHNISDGGMMGVADLAPETRVHVRYEDGTVVPAVVKWSAEGYVGLAFVEPHTVDTPPPLAN